MIIRTLVAAFLFSMAVSQRAYGQTSSEIGFEGHVFNQRTNKTLSGAIITLFQEVQATNSNRAFTLTTDAGGLYAGQLAALFPDPGDESTAINTVLVSCRTKKGVISRSFIYYNVLQPATVYRRDYYLDVPSNVKACL